MKVITCILCENIRFETGNKHSLMGVYEDNIIFNVTPDKANMWPKSQPLALFIKIKGDERDIIPQNGSLKIYSSQNHNKNELISLEIPNSEIKNFNIVLNLNSFRIGSSGEIIFTLDIFTESGEQVGNSLELYKVNVKEIVKS